MRGDDLGQDNRERKQKIGRAAAHSSVLLERHCRRTHWLHWLLSFPTMLGGGGGGRGGDLNYLQLSSSSRPNTMLAILAISEHAGAKLRRVMDANFDRPMASWRRRKLCVRSFVPESMTKVTRSFAFQSASSVNQPVSRPASKSQPIDANDLSQQK